MGASVYSAAIQNRLQTLFSAAYPAVPISYDNVPFVEPTTSWIRLEIWDGPSEKMSLGDGAQRRRYVATAFVTIYHPKNQGTLVPRQIADTIVGIFRDVQVSGITFRSAAIQREGEKYFPATGSATTATAQWYMTRVAIPFVYDEIV